MEILRVSLKQHTPLLHFQPNEPGATLRASEVKPRLDRYIIEHEGNGPYDTVKEHLKTAHRNWFIDKAGVCALNYSLRIIAGHMDSQIRIREKAQPQTKENRETHEMETYYSLENFPLILSNMGGKTDRNKLANLSYTQEPIELIFLIDKKEGTVVNNGESLLSIIEKYIVSFFSINNFGQRSDKGFGSFTVSKINNETVSLLSPSDCYISYYIDHDRRNQFMTLFTVIDYYWKYLKSGINYTVREVNKFDESIYRKYRDYYHKSFLYKYLNREDIQLTWEKRIVKQQLHLASAKLNDDRDERPNNYPYFFARAHLGCPVNGILYKKMKGKVIQKFNRISESCDMINVVISNNRKQFVQRIPAPIVFKPVFDGVKFVIYILFDQKIIAGINAIPNDLMFNFQEKKTNLSVSIPMFVQRQDGKYTIDYSDLIKSFHKSLNYKLPVINAQRKQIIVAKLS